MAESLLERLARAERELAEREARTIENSTKWFKEHAHVVNRGVHEGSPRGASLGGCAPAAGGPPPAQRHD